MQYDTITYDNAYIYNIICAFDVIIQSVTRIGWSQHVTPSYPTIGSWLISDFSGLPFLWAKLEMPLLPVLVDLFSY